MDRIHVRIDRPRKQRLEVEAAREGVTPSEIVRRAIDEHLGKQAPTENCRQLAERLGILGVYKDGPTDLSTNPIHMEGFGLD